MMGGRDLWPVATTQVAAVIGSPVRHSLSPVLHNAAFRALGLDWAYLAFDVAPGQAAQALVGMKALGIAGLSVTMPHKQDVARAVDELSPAAAKLDAVNCVVVRDGRLVGENTDGVGFLRAFEEEFDQKAAGLRFVVVGAGGAARSVVLSLAQTRAAEIVILNRSAGAAEVAAQLAGACGRVGRMEDLTEADVIINATPVGMASTNSGGAVPFDPNLFRPEQVMVDLIYHPLETPILAEAKRRGLRTGNGLGMLIHQAGVAFEHWTTVGAPIDTMRGAALKHLARSDNK